MINRKDLYTYYTIQPIVCKAKGEEAEDEMIGTTVITYEVKRYRDLRNLSDTFAYQILCTQRIVIPNKNIYAPGSASINGFNDYPAVVTNQIQFCDVSTTPELVSYSPRTVNASVSTSISKNSSASNAVSMQHASGSSTSQSNSFGTSASIGFFGDAPTGGFSVNYDQTWGSERSRSVTAGKDSGSSVQNTSSDAMSVKDWACFAYLDAIDSFPTWVWGQEYPWNVLQYRSGDGTSTINLPEFVQSLLIDSTTNQLLPPSALSQFGIDFTMKAVWNITPKQESPVSITHTISYFTASHTMSGDKVEGTFSTSPQTFTYTTTPALDLFAYGLDPIVNARGASVAIVGFIPRQFFVQPAPAKVEGGKVVSPTPFSIIAASNNMLIRDTTVYGTLTTEDKGAGFTPSETALTATFTQNCKSLTIALSFKVIDTTDSYRLYLKHWKTGATGVMLTIVINYDPQKKDNAAKIIKYADALEAEGGEQNLLSISLRDLSYGSVDYHDYLKLGLNTVAITLTPIDDALPCEYQVRAISIERE